MSDMKCPFCQQELNSVAGTVDCTNFDCIKTRGWYGNKELWRELICTRKVLEEAKNTLQWYNDNYDSVVAKETLNEIEIITNQGSEK